MQLGNNDDFQIDESLLGDGNIEIDFADWNVNSSTSISRDGAIELSKMLVRLFKINHDELTS